MSNRREFIHASIAVALVPLIDAHALADRDSVPLYKVVFDHRFPASVQFGREMQALGAAVAGIQGDVTSLWYHDLYHRWKQGPAPIAGMTTPDALFCLERLAWHHGMRVLVRNENPALDNSERLISWTIGPKPQA